MPPLARARASKACDLCRKHKTRCYASHDTARTCLRCDTLAQPCSLNAASESARGALRQRFVSPDECRPSIKTAAGGSHAHAEPTSVDRRLERLERTVQSLADRLDARLDDIPQARTRASRDSQRRTNETNVGSELSPAPVLLIRDAAVDAGVEASHSSTNQATSQPDVIASGIMTLPTALSLLQLFCEHYGRWVRFPQHSSTEVLLGEVRRSPLLLSSVCLIAVRHTTQELADTMAPKLFEEAKSLVQSSLLTAPQPLQFFQAVLILSLWSTTIGQVLLSVDSWLLTGYALQQALASPDFEGIVQAREGTPRTKPKVETWCIWNHLCLAHLQYCVGTRKPSALSEAQIDACVSLLEHKDVDNFESRMAAEIKLYWIILKKCSASELNLVETEAALMSWHREWSALFNQPRSQFLKMGYEFAYLITYYQSLKSLREVNGASVLEEMIRRCQNIINLVVGTADDRTPHLTDHIYLVVAFSALTLCRLVHTYEPQLEEAGHDVATLDAVVVKLVKWLRTVGLPCHVAPLLGRIVFAQFKTLRTNSEAQDDFSPDLFEEFSGGGPLVNFHSLSTNAGFPYPDLIGSELFYTSDGMPWPQWG